LGLLRWSVGGSGVVVPGFGPDSEAGRELGERDSNWIMVGQFGDEFVVATAQVLDERVPGCDNAQRSDRVHSAHRPQPSLESPVISFHSVVRILLENVSRRRDEVVNDARVHRRTVRGDLDWSRTSLQRTGEERPGCRSVATLADQDVDDLPVLVDRAVEVGPLAGDLDVGVGSGRGAVSVFRLIRFLGPPAEPVMWNST
jgi:hypothetical protein